jgi:hypothetical protein
VKTVATIPFTGSLPARGDVAGNFFAVSRPDLQAMYLSTGGLTIALPEPANDVRVSAAGQWAWNGQISDPGKLYRGTTPAGPVYGQSAYLFVGEDLRSFADAATWQATSGWAYVDEAGQIVYGSVVRTCPPLAMAVKFHDVWIGQGTTGGLCCYFPGEDSPRLILAGNADTVRVSRTGDTFRILVVNNPAHLTTILEVTLDELTALPPIVASALTFAFTHPVIVAPFKADGSGQPDLFTFGTYSEEPSLPSPMPSGRLLLAHDGQSDWLPPAGLRPFDVPMLECYLVTGETVDQSAARWTRQMLALLAEWPGSIGAIPMFYDQGGIPGGTPPELWPVATVLQGITHLSAIVNLSPRIVLIAPFEYNRLNGIIAHPELQAAFAALVAAAAQAGLATLPLIATEDAMVRPGIAIRHYDDTIKAGQPWILEFDLGVDTPADETHVTVRIGADGNLTVSASNAGGCDQTGMRRIVSVQ